MLTKSSLRRPADASDGHSVRHRTACDGPLEAIGTIGFAVSGAMAATRQRMDVFGVAVLGVIAAIGGGTLRDLLLSEPVSWLRLWWPIPVAAATAVATIPIALHLGPEVDSRRTVLTADALGLAVFSVLGCL